MTVRTDFTLVATVKSLKLETRNKFDGVTSPSVDGSDPEYLLSQTTSSMLSAGWLDTEGYWSEQSSAK